MFGRARGSAVEHPLHTRGVDGSIPSAPTNSNSQFTSGFASSAGSVSPSRRVTAGQPLRSPSRAPGRAAPSHPPLRFTVDRRQRGGDPLPAAPGLSNLPDGKSKNFWCKLPPPRVLASEPCATPLPSFCCSSPASCSRCTSCAAAHAWADAPRSSNDLRLRCRKRDEAGPAHSHSAPRDSWFRMAQDPPVVEALLWVMPGAIMWAEPRA